MRRMTIQVIVAILTKMVFGGLEGFLQTQSMSSHAAAATSRDVIRQVEEMMGNRQDVLLSRNRIWEARTHVAVLQPVFQTSTAPTGTPPRTIRAKRQNPVPEGDGGVDSL